jgi:hypothetical protein
MVPYYPSRAIVLVYHNESIDVLFAELIATNARDWHLNIISTPLCDGWHLVFFKNVINEGVLQIK